MFRVGLEFRMMLRLLGVATLVLTPACAVAQTPTVIRVIGHGSARTAPDLAVLTLGVRGEGATQEAAIRALAASRARIDEALAGRAKVTTGKLAVASARDRACDPDDTDATRLSTGACAIRGYVATLGMTAWVVPLTEAGTLLAEVARLGAAEPSIDRFEVQHPEVARRAALNAAMTDARMQASAIAASSNVALGRLRRVEDQRAIGDGVAQDVVVTGQLRRPHTATNPIALSPEPVETRADLIVEFELGAAAH